MKACDMNDKQSCAHEKKMKCKSEVCMPGEAAAGVAHDAAEHKAEIAEINTNGMFWRMRWFVRGDIDGFFDWR